MAEANDPSPTEAELPIFEPQPPDPGRPFDGRWRYYVITVGVAVGLCVLARYVFSKSVVLFTAVRVQPAHLVFLFGVDPNQSPPATQVVYVVTAILYYALLLSWLAPLRIYRKKPGLSLLIFAVSAMVHLSISLFWLKKVQLG